MRWQRGSAVVEYAGIVAVVVCLFAVLLILRPASAGQRAPVRPIPVIISLIQTPAASVIPRATPRPRGPRQGRTRLRAPTSTVMLPTWLAPVGS